MHTDTPFDRSGLPVMRPRYKNGIESGGYGLRREKVEDYFLAGVERMTTPANQKGSAEPSSTLPK